MNKWFVFKWKIEDFTRCPLPTGKYLYSPFFVADTPYQTYWRLQLYPKGLVDSQSIACYLECHKYNEPRQRRIDFDIAILDYSGDSCGKWELRNVCFKNSDAVGFSELIPWSSIESRKDHWLPKESLTLQCRIRATYFNPPYEALEELSQNFMKLYLCERNSDLTIKCEEESLPVHRDIVCARAPKFSRNFSLKISKSKLNCRYRTKIHINDVSVDCLKAFLLYVYCGVVVTTKPAVWDNLYEFAERYKLYDMKRDIFPTPTTSYVRTRLSRTKKSIIFPIHNFSVETMCCFGQLIPFDFFRIGIEYFNHDVVGMDNVGILVWCFQSDETVPQAIKLFCSVSAIDVAGNLHYTLETEISFASTVATLALPPTITKEMVLNHTFLRNDTLNLMFTFTAVTEMELIEIEDEKTTTSFCIGMEPPSRLTLTRLSEDFEVLVGNPSNVTLDFNHVNLDNYPFQKAILSAWSPAYEEYLSVSKKRRKSLNNLDTEIGQLFYRFLCTGRITIPSFSIASDLYSMNRKFLIDSLTQICLKVMALNLDETNIIEALILGYTYQEDEFYTFCQNFVCHHKEQILDTEEWANLSWSHPFIVGKIVLLMNDYILE